MNLDDAVKYVADRFQYRRDPKWFEFWTVMKERDGVMIGDCDDFSLTVIWKLCEENFLKFIWNVLILHRYRFYWSKASSNEWHIIGYAQNRYFDNWSKRAMNKEDFLSLTRHKIYVFIPSPLIVIYMFTGWFLRNR